jgi:RsiW-degrading membrane proteinase PrsW (M82 family)
MPTAGHGGDRSSKVALRGRLAYNAAIVALGGMHMTKLLGAFGLVLLLFAAAELPALADTEAGPDEDALLAERHSPVLYFHENELFRPQPAEVIVEQARLRRSRRLWFDVNVLLSLGVAELAGLDSDSTHFLDIWYGDDGSSAYLNYSAHRAYYEGSLSPEAGGPSATVYAHVVREEDPAYITIQYWMLYYYNDWFNKHEGDWEMVQVVLTSEGQPLWFVLSQHHGGTRRPWRQTTVENGTHPAVYVALGSHANYFVGDEVYPNGASVGSVRVEIMDRTGTFGRLMPEVIVIPDREEVQAAAGLWPGASWLAFRGKWGQAAGQADFGGPLGPADKGAQWETPFEWGMAQPLDLETWYAQRLRVEATGTECADGQVSLRRADGQEVLAAEELGSLAILHSDPATRTDLIASLVTSSPGECDIVAVWPRRAEGSVTRLRYEGVPFSGEGSATLLFGSETTPTLTLYGNGELAAPVVEPSEVDTAPATWDAPDLVWVGGVLPVDELVLGLIGAVLGAVVPAILFVGLLYWVDRYEKEPRRLLAAAFLWGAVPAVVTALVVEVFFQLPPQLIGPEALEALRLGMVAPFVQEALKGMAVLFVFWRYRDEFDNLLDGVIYGATTGFGFAMTGNLLSYLAGFALWGPTGLSASAFAEGLLSALNQGLYTAVFGAGVGWARLERKRLGRWGVPALAYLLAVGLHAFHRFASERALGLNVLSVSLTLVGLGAMAAVGLWSLARQRRIVSEELAGRVPEELYREMTVAGERVRGAVRAWRVDGYSAWRNRRRLQELCAELAFRQRRRRQGLPVNAGAIRQLREEIRELSGGG